MTDALLETTFLISHPYFRSKGYASFDYEDAGYAASDLVKVRGVGLRSLIVPRADKSHTAQFDAEQ